MGFSMYSNTDLNTGLPTKTARHHFMMYTPRARLAFQYQHFFFEQREKLGSLLNAVSADARAAANGSHFEVDYFELTSVVTQLLGEAQTYSVLTCDQLERDGVQMQPFADKVRIVERVATQLRLRLSATSQKSVSKKRARFVDDDEEEEDVDVTSAVKRYRNAPADHDMVVEPAFCGRYGDRYLHNAWWTQPIYQ